MKRVELLAPAGNYESLIGALNAGADAVYLGGEKFGARAFAENFTTEQLVLGIKYAHVLGKKIFLTINTLVKEKEFQEIYDYVYPFYIAGLDAVIVQDIGVFEFIKTHFPDLELHVSTQMTLTGVYGAKMLAEMGAKRVVPARELSLEEIKDMKREFGLEIETFIHGAMCYCYSGQCLFSSYLGGRSGNRGKCAQPCRLPYEVEQNNNKITNTCYPLSLKDMCTIEQLPQLLEAGIDSFKIEGRMKKPEYVAGVTAIYRKYIDLYYSNPDSFKVEKKDLDILKTLYIRSEILDGYYYRHNGREMITFDSPSYSGSDEKLLKSIRELYLKKESKCEIKMEAFFLLGQNACLKVKYKDKEITVFGQEVNGAIKSPITRENIEKGLLTLGDSFFTCSDFELTMDDAIFYSLKAIKDLRREAIDKLTGLLSPDRQFINEVMGGENITTDCVECGYGEKESPNFRVLISKKEQLEAYLESKMNASHLILESDLLHEVKDFLSYMEQYKESLINRNKKIPKVLVALPYVLRKRDYSWILEKISLLRKIDGVLVRNLESYSYLKESGYEKDIFGDAGLYVWNKQTALFWQRIKGVCLPLELSKKEKLSICSSHPNIEQIVYGHMPMMITANCIAKTTVKCQKDILSSENTNKKWEYTLIDRMNKKLPVYTCCDHCYNVIYNAVVLSLHETVKEKSNVDFRLNLTVESKEDSISVLDYFASLRMTDCAYDLQLPYSEYTLGHEKKGAL